MIWSNEYYWLFPSLFCKKLVGTSWCFTLRSDCLLPTFWSEVKEIAISLKSKMLQSSTMYDWSYLKKPCDIYIETKGQCILKDLFVVLLYVTETNLSFFRALMYQCVIGLSIVSTFFRSLFILLHLHPTTIQYQQPVVPTIKRGEFWRLSKSIKAIEARIPYIFVYNTAQSYH